MTKKKEVKKLDPLKDLRAELRQAKATASAYSEIVQHHSKEISRLHAVIGELENKTPEGRILVLESAIKKALQMHHSDPARHKTLQDALTPPVEGKAS